MANNEDGPAIKKNYFLLENIFAVYGNLDSSVSAPEERCR